jgi:LuxR family transcriptional regulator, maltose regulon positive regulatory protein
MAEIWTHRPIALPELLLPRPADQAPIGLPGRVTLITSATGFGKSTLLASWAQRHSDAIAWFSPVAFMQPEEAGTSIMQAIASAVGQPGKAMSMEEIDSAAFASTVHELVTAYEKPITIVLDGPEFVRGDPTALQVALRLLVEHQPANLGIVVVSRNFPIAAAEVARLRGALDLIDERLLRIPDDAMFKVLDERGATKAQAQELVDFLGGWPAAIRIALTIPEAETTAIGLRQQVKELGAARFFTNALIDRIPDPLRIALLATAVFDVVTVDAARALGLSDEEAKSLLTAYEQGIPLMRRSEDPRAGFVVHTLFRDELLDRLRRDDFDAEGRLRVKAAKYFTDHSMTAQAIEQLISAGDFEAAAKMLKENYTQLLEQGHGVRMRSWYEKTGHSDSPRSEQLRKRIYASIIDGQLAQAESLLSSYELEIAAENSTFDAKAFLHINRAWVSQGRGDIDGVVTYARAALEVLHEPGAQDDPRYGEYLDASNDYIAQAAIITDQPNEKDPRIAAVIDPLGRPKRPSIWLEVSHPALLAHLAVYRGEWSRALSFGQRAIDATPKDLFGSVLYPWPALVATAGSLREMGDAQGAVDLIDQHLETIQALPILLYAVDLLAVRAHALADLGRIAEGSDTFAISRKMVETYGRGWWPFDRLDSHEARFVLRHGDTARASQIAERLHNSSAALVLKMRLETPKAPRRAQQLIGQMRRQTPLEECTFRLFSAALVPNGSAEQDEHLRHALQIAQEHGSFRSIFDSGPFAIELLTAHLLRNPSRYGETLVSKYRAAESSLASSDGRVSLSAREHQILGMLASDLPLQQVARTLFVSQNTLKTHLRNLYRKMQVSDRHAAVEKGRQLLLIK